MDKKTKERSVEPIKEKEMLITKWKRPIEEKIKKHYRENKGE